jgi:hypothetical protein
LNSSLSFSIPYDCALRSDSCEDNRYAL